VRIQNVILATKDNICASEWGAGKYPKSKFPLSKAGKSAYSLGSAWRWRFVEFQALGLDFVVRVIVNESKTIARAHLALKNAKDCTVLCCLEYHADLNTGWHLHTLCGEENDLATAPTGTLVHGPWVKRLPSVRQPHRRIVYAKDMNGGPEAWIWHECMRFFRVTGKGSLV
jgi:hypothetical protein